MIYPFPRQVFPLCQRLSREADSRSPVAQVSKEHDELQFEEDDGINRRTTTTCVGFLDKLAHKREIKRSLEMPIEVILWN